MRSIKQSRLRIEKEVNETEANDTQFERYCKSKRVITLVSISIFLLLDIIFLYFYKIYTKSNLNPYQP